MGSFLWHLTCTSFLQVFLKNNKQKDVTMTPEASIKNIQEDEFELNLFIKDLMSLLSINSEHDARKYVIDFVNKIHPEQKSSRAMLEKLKLENSDEEEDKNTPLVQFINNPSISALPLFPREIFLGRCADLYIESIKYLKPIIDAFAKSVSLTAKQSNFNYINLLLRDGLVFLPALLNRNATENLSMTLYSRKHQRAGLKPQGFTLNGEHIKPETPSNVLHVDVGLYGSLLSDLTQKEVGNGAFFLGSRNPFIVGWLNTIISAQFLTENEAPDFNEVIKLVDTVESLLKPFRITLNTDGTPVLNWSDPISLYCSLLFMWYLKQKKEEPINPIQLHVRKKSDWYVTTPVPRWQKADEFIKNWELGLVPPMNILSGLGLQ